MALSRGDERQLRRIERAAWTTEPGWARMMSDHSARMVSDHDDTRRGRPGLPIALYCAATVLVGVGTFVDAYPVAILGLLALVASVCVHISRP